MAKNKTEPAIQLGWRVRDKVSEITGIAVARIEYLNGCIQWCIVPKYTPGALEVSSFYIDEPQLEKVDDGVFARLEVGEHRSFGANIQPRKYGAKP